MPVDMKGSGLVATSNYVFPYQEIFEFGNGALQVKSACNNVTMQNVIADVGYRVLEVKSGPVTSLLVERVTATGLTRGLLRIGNSSRGGIIRAVGAVGTVVDTDADMPCGFKFEDKASDFLLERVVARNFQQRLAPDKYWNGDGFSTERDNDGFIFRQCEAHDNSDGGFDLKSTNTRLEDCTASGNARNFRFWSSAKATTLTSINPVMRGGIGGKAHFGVYGASGTTVEITIDKVVARGPGPLFSVENGPVRIIVGDHDIQGVDKLLSTARGGTAQIFWKTGAPKTW